MKCARRILALLGVLTACLALCQVAGSRGADPPRAATIQDLESHPVQVNKGGQVSASDSTAMASYQRFLALQQTDPKLRAEALRRLGDLNLDAGELQRMQSELSSIDVHGAEAIKLYTTLLSVYPGYEHNDEVLYQLARAYDTTGQPDQALRTLDLIVQRYPDSREIDEVQFRRGELLFSARRYSEAEQAYAAVIARGASSSFYLQSLYKSGWSLYKESLPRRSLPLFARLLDVELLGPDGRMRPLTDLKRADRELVDDSLRVMSITFSEDSGAESVGRFVGSYGARPYDSLLYSKLGDLYVAKQRYQDAASTYLAYVDGNPQSDAAPDLAARAIRAYSKGGFSQLVFQAKRDYVGHYGFDSPYWRTHARADHPEVTAELEADLRDVATYDHAMAQRTHDVRDYAEAARWYRQYLDSFPTAPDAAELNHRLADALFAAHDYARAAAEYEHAAYGYPRNPQSESAGYAALTAYQKAESGLSGQALADLQRRAIDSGVKFAQAFPDHPDSAGVLTRADEAVFAAGDLKRAVEIGGILLARNPPADEAKRRIAWTIIGQADYNQGRFSEAEPAFIHARELAGSDSKLSADLTERIAAAVYRQGAARRQAGDGEGAVRDFLRVEQVAPGSTVCATALYDASAQLIQLKEWSRAIQVLRDFRARFPHHALSADVDAKLAVAYAGANQPMQAAQQFEMIAEEPAQKPALRKEALRRAADLFAQAHDLPRAMTALEKLVSLYPTPLADAEEARQRLADYAVKLGNLGARDRWYREIVKADAEAGTQRTPRTHFLAAKAQLALAAEPRDAFRAIRLTLPLARTLKAKRKAMERAMAAYRLAATYDVAEVTTAATYQMAGLYQTLAHDVLASERPRNLSGQELDEYNSLLEDQVFPFEEQAIKIYGVNAARTQQGIYDEWVRKSFTALAQLDPARYGKTEQMSDVVTTLN
ncbi:MAG TPA: tetratricopeptide repeat protein [Steroidobacteraceae bacterium]|nr:tetratricopeptide repeat protein [Steroidobacteraceae bacterium]